MKNRLTALAAATAICAIAAAPAFAGYTIYEDTGMPSVLFIEFDEPEGGETEQASGPRRSSVPVVIQGGVSDDSGQGGGGSSAFSDDRGGGDDDEPSFEQQMDDAMTIDNDRVRDVVVDEVIRRELFDE